MQVDLNSDTGDLNPELFYVSVASGVGVMLSHSSSNNSLDHSKKTETAKTPISQSKKVKIHLTFTTLWAYSADDVLVIFFPENRICYFTQIVSIGEISLDMQLVSTGDTGDNLHEMSKSVFWEKVRKIFQYVIYWKFYPE